MGAVAGAGRKPKPTGLRIVEGNREHRPINENEPKPQPVAPKMPKYVTGRAAKLWREYAPRLERLGILTEIDGMAFAALCIEFGQYIELRDRGGEPIQEFATGARQVAPEVAVAHKCLDKARALFAEFGLTPSSRARLSIAASSKDDFEEFL